MFVSGQAPETPLIGATPPALIKSAGFAPNSACLAESGPQSPAGRNAGSTVRRFLPDMFAIIRQGSAQICDSGRTKKERGPKPPVSFAFQAHFVDRPVFFCLRPGLRMERAHPFRERVGKSMYSAPPCSRPTPACRSSGAKQLGKPQALPCSEFVRTGLPRDNPAPTPRVAGCFL